MKLAPVRAALTALLLATALPACAQKPARAPGDADPALWVVKDADTTIYLFGTIHVLKPGLTWFDEAVKAAFDKSDSVVLELVMPDPATMQGLVMAQGMAKDGPTLTEQLPAARRAAFAKAMAESGVPQLAYDRMRPWLAANYLALLPLTKLGYDPANGPEQIITAAAKTAGKPVTGLETAQQQLGYFGGLSQGAQLQFLESTIDELPKLDTTMATMVSDWSKGDPVAIANELNDSLKDSPEVAKVLLIDRNKRWADWIDTRMKTPGTVFVAVGAGHLAGGDSVIAELAKHGVKVTRVAY